ncbi:hypothetical protein MMC17_002594 [Xylographa soralifera]|nr:hypothetical protein [Xylographa soralifera]
MGDNGGGAGDNSPELSTLAFEIYEIDAQAENVSAGKPAEGASEPVLRVTLEKAKYRKAKTLADLRKYIKISHPKALMNVDQFCYRNCTTAPDSTELTSYLAISKDPSDPVSNKDRIYFLHTLDPKPLPPPEVPVVPPKTPSQILEDRPFLIVTALWAAGESSNGVYTIKVTGSIHSKSLDAGPLKERLATDPKAAESLSLAALRKLTPSMSSFSAVHKFCTPSGTTVPDESLSLGDYLALEPEAPTEDSNAAAADDKSGTKTKKQVAGSSGIASVKLFYKQSHDNLTEVKIPESIKVDMTMKERPDGKKADEYQAQERKSLIEDERFTTGADNGGAGSLTEAEWGTVLRNCGVFYGWIVDINTKKIVRAPKPAFQLRSKINLDPVYSIPDFAASTAKSSTIDKTVPPNGTVTKPADSKSSPSEPDESEPDESEPDELEPDGSEPDGSEPDESKPVESIPDKSKPDEWTPEDTKPDKPSSDDLEPTQAIPAATSKPIQLQDKPDKGIPNFRVNDDSKIEVTVCEHEFEESMARNDFSSQSTESSVSGGYAGWSVAVSAGFASSESSSTKNKTNLYQKTFIARYMYPRCDLFLYSDDLEPTPELARAIAFIKATKSIQGLRKLHTDYGHLFCQNLTLGARLTATEIMKSKEIGSEQEQKQQFKTSVGVAVSTPIGISTSVKHETEQGSSESKNTTTKDTEDSKVFEAVGGDTILANNPAAWAPTVANHQFWRVINRDALVPFADILAAMPGYAEVNSWFVKAVPAVSPYITLDDSHQIMSRLRLVNPLNGLSLSRQNDAAYYLGHRPDSPCKPRKNGVNLDPDKFWVEQLVQDIGLFTPERYQAPAILGYSDNKVGIEKYGAKYNAAFAETEWSIIAPFSDTLTHGCRVILKNNPFIDDTRTAGAQDTTPPSSHMVVFRNQQGVFLPAMSDIDEFQYWRILKKDFTAPSEHIKEGDEIRLAWSFKDQTTGFRDYKDDLFGRRRNQCPPELQSGVLYLKLPWPRFEWNDRDVEGKEGARSNIMVMSTLSATQETAEEMETALGTFSYVMQDVRFRIDTVANNGLGDANDYMLRDVRQARGIDPGILRDIIMRAFFF